MRTGLPLLLLLLAAPVAAGDPLPQIEPETSIPVWGDPDARRAYFEAERRKLEEERARLEEERRQLAEARARDEAEAEDRAARSGRVISPGYRPRGYRVLICDDRPGRRPHHDFDYHAGPADDADARTFIRRKPEAERCRYVWREHRKRRDGVVLRYGPDGFSGRLRLSGPDGRITIEAR